jgi:hypothetical protein
MIKAAEIRSLSATGSKNLPRVDSRPRLRANRPSSRSVTEAVEKTMAASIAHTLFENKRNTMSTGMLAILYKVKWLGEHQNLAEKRSKIFIMVAAGQ